MVFASNSILLWDPWGMVSCKSANARQSNYMDGPGEQLHSEKLAKRGQLNIIAKGVYKRDKEIRANKAE